jgi:hypothetical protein
MSRKFIFGGSFLSIPPLDPDAEAFLTAAAITDPTITSAIDTLVVQLKADGIWTKMKALYPFVGGTASTHKFNLKNPVDSDAAFRLVFNGGWTHSSNGITSGVNGYADTKLIPSSVLSLNSTHISSYVRIASLSTSRALLGSCNSGFAGGLFMIPNISNRIYYDVNSSTGANTSQPNTVQTGLFVASRINSTQMQPYRNGTSLGVNNVNSSLLNSREIVLLALNNNGAISNYYGAGNIAFTSIGDGLTDTEASNLYTAVQSFQTTLGRQV